MATKKTKTLKDVTTVTTVNNDQYMPLADASGKVTKITLDNLKVSILGGMSLEAITDGIRVVFSDGSHVYSAESGKWPNLQNNDSRIAEGVLVAEGGKLLVIALTEALLKWSSAAVSGGGKTTSDRITALNDWEGKTSTAAQIKHAECQGESYAPGFCNLYSITNSNGVGMSAGKWWLPSVGEMMMIAANKYKINYALSLINGATMLSGTYWTSTESDSTFSWTFNVDNSGTWASNKLNYDLRARPVTAFL